MKNYNMKLSLTCKLISPKIKHLINKLKISYHLVFLILALVISTVQLAEAQPPNDNCANAINITTLDGTCSTFDFNNATPDVANGACVEGNNNSWFTFTAVGPLVDITVSGINRPEFTLVEFGTPCSPGTATVVFCADLTGNYSTISETNISIITGTTYTLLITNNNNTNGTIDLCITNNAPTVPCGVNSLCSNAESVAVTAGTQSCVTGCNTGADRGPDFEALSCYDFPDETVWYSVTTGSTDGLMDVSLSSSDLTDPKIAIIATTDCNSGNVSQTLDCAIGSGGNVSASQIIIAPSSTYYIVVSDDNGNTGNFDLCIDLFTDNSACNTNKTLEVVATSMGSPLTGPFLPSETVEFCYTVNQWIKDNCNWFQGIVPTFGDCWDPSSFNPSGEPTVTTPLTNAGASPGFWGWNTSVFYNNIIGSLPMGGLVAPGWFFVLTAQDPSDPDNTFGDGDHPTDNCEINGNGYTWTICFELTVADQASCSVNNSCSVSIKTYADGEVGVWDNTACVNDLPSVFNSVPCCGPSCSIGLPLDLLSFSARTQQEGEVLLSWETAREENVSHFELLRSMDGENWEAISKVTAQNKISNTYYEEWDYPSAAKMVYYQLKVIDFDESFTYSDIITVKLLSNIQQVSVYPIPANNLLIVDTHSNFDTDYDIAIYNSTGDLVMKRQEVINPLMELDIRHLPSGSYFLKIISDEKIESITFVKVGN